MKQWSRRLCLRGLSYTSNRQPCIIPVDTKRKLQRSSYSDHPRNALVSAFTLCCLWNKTARGDFHPCSLTTAMWQVSPLRQRLIVTTRNRNKLLSHWMRCVPYGGRSYTGQQYIQHESMISLKWRLRSVSLMIDSSFISMQRLWNSPKNCAWSC